MLAVRLLPTRTHGSEDDNDSMAASAQRMHAQHWTTVTHMLSRVYDATATAARMDARLRDSSLAHLLTPTARGQHDGSSSHRSSADDMHVPLHCAFDGYAPEVVMRSVRALVESRSGGGGGATSASSSSPSSLSAPQQLLSTLETCWQQYTHSLLQHMSSRVVALQAEAEPQTQHTQQHEQDVNDSSTALAASATQQTSSTSAYYAFASLVQLWLTYRAAVQETCAVCVYLARWYAAQPTGVASLEQVAVRCFAHALHAHAPLVHAALDGYLRALQCDLAAEARALCGCNYNNNNNNNSDNNNSSMAAVAAVDAEAMSDATTANTTTLRRVLRAFADAALAAQLYFTRVQPLVLSAVQAHYRACVLHMLTQQTCAQAHVTAVTAALAGERVRVRAYLHAHTLPLLEEVAQRTLLGEHGRAIVERSFAALIDGRAYATLATLWRLYTHCAYVDAAGGFISGLFRRYVESAGRACMASLDPDNNNNSNSSNDGSNQTTTRGAFATVRALIALLHRAEEVIAHSFADDRKTFTVQLNEALADVLGLHVAAFAEQLALYVDATMHAVTRGQLPLYCSDVAAAAVAASNSAGGQADATVTPADDAARPDDGAAHHRSGNDNEGADEATQSPQHGATHTQGSSSSSSSDGGATCAEAVLRDIGTLFAHHPSKDCFEHVYWPQLARRLLRAPPTATFAEEQCFLAVLRDICGAPFVAKYEGMLRDVHTSRELDAAYRTASQLERDASKNNSSNSDNDVSADGGGSALASVEVGFFVLSNGMWPTQTPLSLVLPPPWRALVQRVAHYYTQKNRKRQLTWQHQLSTAVLRARGNSSSSSSSQGAKVYLVSGTMLQCAALMTLDDMLPLATPTHHDDKDNNNDNNNSSNNSDNAMCVTIGQLCERLGVELAAPDVMASLYGLCHDSCKLLVHTRATATATAATTAVAPLQPHDTLRINDDYEASEWRVRIPLPTRMRATASATMTTTTTASGTASSAAGAHATPVQTLAAVQQARDRAAAERNMRMEAAIMSYMKAQRTAKHDTLVAAVSQKMPFEVTTAALKRVMEKMLTRGFLERVGHDTYRYVA